MGRFLLGRGLAALPMIFFLLAFSFLLVHMMPGDAAEAIVGDSPGVSVEEVERIRDTLGLNRPVHIQFGEYITGVARGDLGESLFGGRSVTETIIGRFPATLSLTLAATALALAIGLVAGVSSALRPGSWIDRVSTVGASLGLAIPNFWLALVLVALIAMSVPFLPATGYVPLSESPTAWAASIALPALALGTSKAAIIARQTRSAVVDSLQRDYIQTARAKGLSSGVIVWKHALKNAAIPVLTILGLTVTSLLGGSIIIEQVFGIPGLGNLAVTAVNQRDLPTLQGVILFTGVVVLLTNLFIDIAYAAVNPKVRPT